MQRGSLGAPPDACTNPTAGAAASLYHAPTRCPVGACRPPSDPRLGAMSLPPTGPDPPPRDRPHLFADRADSRAAGADGRSPTPRPWGSICATGPPCSPYRTPEKQVDTPQIGADVPTIVRALCPCTGGRRTPPASANGWVAGACTVCPVAGVPSWTPVASLPSRDPLRVPVQPDCRPR